MLPNIHHHTLAIWGLIIGCILFGMGSLIVATSPLGAYAIAFWRLLIAGLFFTLWLYFRQPTLPKKYKTWLFAASSGLFLAWDLALWHESIYAVGPGISTLLNSLQVFFLAAIGFLIFHERITRLQAISLILATGGVALIASPEWQHNTQAAWGFASGLISGACLALSMVFIRKTHESEPINLTSLMMILSFSGALCLLPIALIDNKPFFPNTTYDIAMVVVYGIVMQCIAWGLIAYSIPRLSLTLTGLILLSEPVAALIIDELILHKNIAFIQYMGCILTLFAIYLGTVRKKAA